MRTFGTWADDGLQILLIVEDKDNAFGRPDHNGR